MTLIEMIESRVRYLGKVLDFTSARLRNAEEGLLSTKNNNGKMRYYRRMKGSSADMVYLGLDKLETVKRLEEKEYLLKVQKSADEERLVLERAARDLGKGLDPDCVFLSIPAERRNLIEPIVIDGNAVGDKDIKSWSRADRKTNDFLKKANYVTQNGETVRSKSELIIADRLKASGVPYKYEPPMTIVYEEMGEFCTRYPDFKVLNLRTGQSYYWEHFGFMDDEKYRASSIEKLEKYAEIGLFPGKNLIITMETVKHPLNTKYLDSVINEYLK